MSFSSFRRTRLFKVLWITTAVLGASTAFIGFLHTPAGRPIMSKLLGDRCPAMFASASGVENARRMGVQKDRGKELAPARPALGFTLEQTTAGDVMAWAEKTGTKCEREKAWMIRCSGVDSRFLGGSAGTGTVEEITLGFRENGKLVNVATLRRGLSPDEGRRVHDVLAASLRRDIADAKTSGGVSSKKLSSSRTSLRYSDYFADITAMNLPTSGVAVREQYLSAKD